MSRKKKKKPFSAFLQCSAGFNPVASKVSRDAPWHYGGGARRRDVAACGGQGNRRGEAGARQGVANVFGCERLAQRIGSRRHGEGAEGSTGREHGTVQGSHRVSPFDKASGRMGQSGVVAV